MHSMYIFYAYILCIYSTHAFYVYILRMHSSIVNSCCVFSIRIPVKRLREGIFALWNSNPVNLHFDNFSLFFVEIKSPFDGKLCNVRMCNDRRLNELLDKSKTSAVVD
jgi:hypothetical protein